MSIIGTIHEDVTTDVLGQVGSWQWLVTFVSAALMLPTMFNQYEDMFLLRPSEVFCVLPTNEEVLNSSLCSETVRNNGTEELKCEQWRLKLLWFISLRKSWLVFCDDKMKLLSTAIISRFGLFFGCITFGLVADSFGRRTATTLSVLAELIFGLVITFCDSEGWFRLIAFLKSLFGSANFFMGIILVCEVASNKWRSWLCTIVISPIFVRMTCMVPLTNIAPNIETYSFIGCVYSCLCLLLLRWSPESPQWLLYNRKVAIAEKILSRAAKTNGIKLCSNFKIRPVNQRAYNSLEETTTCVAIISIHNVRVTFVGVIIFWMCYNFLWSTLYVRMYSEDNVENVLYLVLKVLSFTTILLPLSVFSSSKLMLRHLLQVHILLTGVLTASVQFLKKGTFYSIISSLALASGLLAHALILNITPRLFAINIRATIYGCCHASGQMGAITSYLLFLFHPMRDISIMAVELALTIILVGLCFIIPDVDERELPDVINDMDYFSELTKPLRWVTQKTNSPSLEEVQMRVYSFGSTQRSLSGHHSDERLPARRIGCKILWNALTRYIIKKFIELRKNVSFRSSTS